MKQNAFVSLAIAAVAGLLVQAPARAQKTTTWSN